MYSKECKRKIYREDLGANTNCGTVMPIRWATFCCLKLSRKVKKCYHGQKDGRDSVMNNF